MYALAASAMQQQHVALADKRISWWARGDIGGSVHRGSLGDSELCTTLNGHSELGAAALTKAIWWDLRLASLLCTCFYSHLSLFHCDQEFLDNSKRYGWICMKFRE